MLAIVLSLTSAATLLAEDLSGARPQELPRISSQEANAQVTAATFTAWRDHIAPLDAEVRWQKIDWHDSLSAGVRAANKQNRPMLLWLMNGHPLGCT
jgi:hypothetical protein